VFLIAKIITSLSACIAMTVRNIKAFVW